MSVDWLVRVTVYPAFILAAVIGWRRNTMRGPVDVIVQVVCSFVSVWLWTDSTERVCKVWVFQDRPIIHEPWFLSAVTFVVGVPMGLLLGFIVGGLGRACFEKRKEKKSRG